MSKKTELMGLNLSESLVDKILDVLDTHKQTLKQYSKPKGKKDFENHLTDIKYYAEHLHKELEKLSDFEKQLLNHIVYPNIFELKTSLILLEFACKESKKKKVRFSRRDPFLIDLTIDLWKLLEGHGITVKKYKDTTLCKVLNILFPESEKPRRHKIDESEAPDDLWAFHLLREASKYLPKN